MSVAAVIFDLDGVLIGSERTWDAARKEVAIKNGGNWSPDAQRAMMGMSSTEWSRYMHDQLAVALRPEEISERVVSRLEELYREQLPLIAGARETVISLSRRWRLGLASSSNRPLIDLVLELVELEDCFAATVSSEEVARGKPAPDVYLEAARRLDIDPKGAIAVEDSANGIRSAAAAEMTVVAIPNRDFPPTPDALALATDVLDSLAELTPGLVEKVAKAAY